MGPQGRYAGGSVKVGVRTGVSTDSQPESEVVGTFLKERRSGELRGVRLDV